MQVGAWRGAGGGGGFFRCRVQEFRGLGVSGFRGFRV